MLTISAFIFTHIAGATPPQCNEDFTTVLYEQYSGMNNQDLRVLNSPAAFCQAWTDIYSNMIPPPPCDSALIDFQSEVGLMVAIGTRNNGCYSVDIPCVHRTANDTIGVAVRETQPGPYCACTQALVDPVTIIAVQRPVDALMLRARVRELVCY